MLLLTDERPRKSLSVTRVKVPAGHAFPQGEVCTVPFEIVLEAGVRWHPEWPTPQVTVNAWRELPLGDALGFAGTSVTDVFGSLISPEVTALAAFHGQTFAALAETGKASLKALGLDAPKKKEPLAAFILPCQIRTRH